MVVCVYHLKISPSNRLYFLTLVCKPAIPLIISGCRITFQPFDLIRFSAILRWTQFFLDKI